MPELNFLPCPPCLWKYFSINVGSTLFLKRHLLFERHQVMRQHSSGICPIGICLDPSVSKVPIVTCMASESTQSYPLFSWPCGNTEVTLFLHNAVYCPPRLSLSRYNVCTPFCENDSVFPLLLGPTHLSVHLALSQGLHWCPPCRTLPPWEAPLST